MGKTEPSPTALRRLIIQVVPLVEEEVLLMVVLHEVQDDFYEKFISNFCAYLIKLHG
ncbi:MAG: hypothetical protein RLZ91_1138 [Bacteroidota bacterium]